MHMARAVGALAWCPSIDEAVLIHVVDSSRSYIIAPETLP
jgi:hypothetical protein